MATITRLVAARMAAINAECFTSDDSYSDPEYVYSQILNWHLHYKAVGKLVRVRIFKEGAQDGIILHVSAKLLECRVRQRKVRYGKRYSKAKVFDDR